MLRPYQKADTTVQQGLGAELLLIKPCKASRAHLCNDVAVGSVLDSENWTVAEDIKAQLKALLSTRCFWEDGRVRGQNATSRTIMQLKMSETRSDMAPHTQSLQCLLQCIIVQLLVSWKFLYCSHCHTARKSHHFEFQPQSVNSASPHSSECVVDFGSVGEWKQTTPVALLGKHKKITWCVTTRALLWDFVLHCNLAFVKKLAYLVFWHGTVLAGVILISWSLEYSWSQAFQQARQFALGIVTSKIVQKMVWGSGSTVLTWL